MVATLVDLNDLFNIESNSNLLHYPLLPPKRLKKSYDHTRNSNLSGLQSSLGLRESFPLMALFTMLNIRFRA
jgi:hypothetical protein